MTENSTTCWAVCALNYDRDSAPIMAVSNNAEDYDLNVGYDSVVDFDDKWVGDHPPGLYRLTFHCTCESGGIMGWAEKVIEVECLVLFPSLATMAADHFVAINQRLQEIQKDG